MKTRDLDPASLHSAPLGSLPTWTSADEDHYREVQRAADLAIEAGNAMKAGAPTPAPTAPKPPTTSAELLARITEKQRVEPDPKIREHVDALLEEKQWRARLAQGTAEWNARCARQRAATGKSASSMLLKKGQ